MNRSFYSQPLTPDWRTEVTSPPPRGSREDLVSEIIGPYYAHLPTFLSASAGAEALETAIAAVWSQQWPRLRMEFSFRTAQLGARPRRSARYDVQVAFPETGEGALGPNGSTLLPTTRVLARLLLFVDSCGAMGAT